MWQILTLLKTEFRVTLLYNNLKPVLKCVGPYASWIQNVLNSTLILNSHGCLIKKAHSLAKSYTGRMEFGI
jgi:hypothetical protein